MTHIFKNYNLFTAFSFNNFGFYRLNSCGIPRFCKMKVNFCKRSFCNLQICHFFFHKRRKLYQNPHFFSVNLRPNFTNFVIHRNKFFRLNIKSLVRCRHIVNYASNFILGRCFYLKNNSVISGCVNILLQMF